MDRGLLKVSLDDWAAWHEKALQRMLPRATLAACLEALDLREGLLLTLDREEREPIRGRVVRMLPVWQYLLGREE